MVELDNMKMELAGYKEPLKEVKASLGLTAKLQRIEEYKREMEAPGFWDDPEVSNTKVKELRSMESVVETITGLETQYEDIETLIEMSWMPLFHLLRISEYRHCYRENSTETMRSLSSMREPAEQRAATGLPCSIECIPDGQRRRAME